ncbi:hypothetical protein BRD17_07375 [Halobacteriales archaeon SW_7_68_16]|nr:MAG: hypothetical protein BRD17_07375 [Halobacteriales archaeon SW_7_68_16]
MCGTRTQIEPNRSGVLSRGEVTAAASGGSGRSRGNDHGGCVDGEARDSGRAPGDRPRLRTIYW